MQYDYHPPPDTGLDIRFLDDYLIVLNKPCGLLSVPGRGAGRVDSLATRVQREYPGALVVHRLDMSTSGLMLMALDAPTQGRMGRFFQTRQVGKRYLAVVAGLPEAPAGRVELPLITDWPKRPRQKIDPVHGKPALTLYRVLSHDTQSDTSRVELVPHTGRTHQLRVHMSAIGHPVLGDEFYADEHARKASDRLLLHAEHLAFVHPRTGRSVQVTCPAEF